MCQSVYQLSLSSVASNPKPEYSCQGMRKVVTKGDQAKLINVTCKCWKCSVCSVKLKKAWKDRFAVASGMFDEWSLSVVHNARDRASLERRVRNNGAVFFRIDFGSKSFLFHSAIDNKRGRSVERFSSVRAREMVAEVMGNHGVTRIGVSDAVPKAYCHTTKSEWSVVATTKATVEKANERLDRKGSWVKLEYDKPFDIELVPIVLGLAGTVPVHLRKPELSVPLSPKQKHLDRMQRMFRV